MSGNQKDLIEKITTTQLLSDRYTNIQCINVDFDNSSSKRGHFSLIFMAYDTVEGKSVILKFLDPEHLGDAYRLKAFQREPEILRRLRNKKRCLQLVDDNKIFDWLLFSSNPETEPVSIKINFFVTEYLSHDIDEFFLDNDKIITETKLKLFRNAVLGVEAIHSENIHHRDLKPDNMRSNGPSENDAVTAIDFGTAAHLDTEHLLPSYNAQVGHSVYASPESFCGLSGLREIGHLTDIYSLGCMLYELFNREFFCTERKKNPHYNQAIVAMRALVLPIQNLHMRQLEWKKQIASFKNVVEPPFIDQPGHTIHPSVVQIIKDIHFQMTQFDYQSRIKSLDQVRKKIDIALKILKNQNISEKKIQQNRIIKENRLKKLRYRELRLKAYLNKEVSSAK